MRNGLHRVLWAVGIAIGVLAAVPWLVARSIMRSARGLDQYDHPAPPLMKDPGDVGPEVEEVTDQLRQGQASFSGDRDERRQQARQWLDELGADTDHACEIIPVQGATCGGEWVVPPDVDTTRRLLYLHGGAFEAGSPQSHRSLTTRVAERTGMAVLVADYGLSPEHTRQETLDDVDAAWTLLCAEGPDGPAPAGETYLMGDSAGGNLALGLAHRLRDRAGRVPDAVVALSPMTDSTYASPSWHENVETDPFLGPGFGRLLELPREVLVLGTWAGTRIRPDDPRVSPLLDDLAGLPPTLLQVSNSEMLRDDAVRYARAARAAGSPVQVQVWPRMVHVWQAFAEVPEAREAMDEVAAFVGQSRAARIA